MSVKKEEKISETVYSKDMLLKSKLFANRKDALSVVIRDSEKLTIEQAKERLAKFMKGKVV